MFEPAEIPRSPAGAPAPEGTRQLLQKLGPRGFAAWARSEKRLLITDTTFRDAHQSLLATRVRTHDMLLTAAAMAHRLPKISSAWKCGAARRSTPR